MIHEINERLLRVRDVDETNGIILMWSQMHGETAIRVSDSMRSKMS